MLPGLSTLEQGRLRISVGHKGQNKHRLLSPIEAGELIKKAINAGGSVEECSKEIKLDARTVNRFLDILGLPDDLHHRIGWGKPQDGIGFACAYEIAKIGGDDIQHNQRLVADKVLTDNLNSKEVHQVAQLHKRSKWKKSIEECLKEVLGMRTTVERRFVLVGTITNPAIQKILDNMPQRERNALCETSITDMGLSDVKGRLGPRFFTLIGDKSFEKRLRDMGKEKIESSFRLFVEKRIGNV